LPPLTVGCAHTVDRSSWPRSAHITGEPAAYVLSAADWRTLVETFGLAADLGDAV